jgi:hypothetical protein
MNAAEDVFFVAEFHIVGAKCSILIAFYVDRFGLTIDERVSTLSKVYSEG